MRFAAIAVAILLCSGCGGGGKNLDLKGVGDLQSALGQLGQVADVFGVGSAAGLAASPAAVRELQVTFELRSISGDTSLGGNFVAHASGDHKSIEVNCANDACGPARPMKFAGTPHMTVNVPEVRDGRRRLLYQAHDLDPRDGGGLTATIWVP